MSLSWVSSCRLSNKYFIPMTFLAKSCAIFIGQETSRCIIQPGRLLALPHISDKGGNVCHGWNRSASFFNKRKPKFYSIMQIQYRPRYWENWILFCYTILFSHSSFFYLEFFGNKNFCSNFILIGFFFVKRNASCQRQLWRHIPFNFYGRNQFHTGIRYSVCHYYQLLS